MTYTPSESGYTPFLVGETIDLCIPSQLAIERDGWAEWFNDPLVTKYLVRRGQFPNTREDQQAFLEQIRRRERLALLVYAKDRKRLVGTVSLSSIDLQVRSAEIAVVVGTQLRHLNLYALEAMARLTAHGFEELGLWRIAANQVYPELKNWNKRMELLGYRAEGIARSQFVKGHVRKNNIILACLYDDYLGIKTLRAGAYWLGYERMMQLVKMLPKKGYAEVLEEEGRRLSDRYFAALKQS